MCEQKPIGKQQHIMTKEKHMKPRWLTSIFECVKQIRSKLSIYGQNARLSIPSCQKTFLKTTEHTWKINNT